MIETGRFPLHGSTFTIGAREFLLRTREKTSKRMPEHYLLALPDIYVSSLWPQRDGRYRIDCQMPDGAERVYRLRFDEGHVVITGGEVSRRSGRSAPWVRPLANGRGAE